MSKKSNMLTSWYKGVSTLIFVFLSWGAYSQHYNLPLDNFSKLFLLRSDTAHIGSFQGLPVNWTDMDTIKGFEPQSRYSEASRKLFDDHLIEIEAQDLRIDIDLLLHFELGFEQKLDNQYQDSTRMSRNMRGFIIRGDIGEKVSFETSFREQQSFVPFYLFDYSGRTGVMPGTGRIKIFNKAGRDHNIAEGYVSYSPSDWVNFQFGTQKNFIGSGYRSLLLSDNSFTYPQLKGSFRFFNGKLRYHVIHAWMQTLDRLPKGDTPESLFIRKDGGFKYLEVIPSPFISIGLFEGVMWTKFNATEGSQSIDPLAYSPIIGTSALALGLDDIDNNALVGMDLTVKPFKGLTLYGQYMMDKEDTDGFQFGVRTVDLGAEGLCLRAEYNSVSAFAYTNEIVRQNYSHFAQPIAHPMGAGFDEFNAGLTYFYKRWFINANYVGADQLIDPRDDDEACTAGGDIFSTLPCAEDQELASYQARLEQVDLRLGRLFNPNSNFNAYVGWLFRERTGASPQQEQSMFTFGIEMSLYNRYEDF